MNVYTDIETVPEQPELEAKMVIADTIKAPSQMKKSDTIEEWHSGSGKYVGVKDAAIEETYRKTSFDGSRGEIISIAWAIEDEDILSKSRQLGECEGDLLQLFFDSVGNAKHSRPPYLIGHYISGFDLRFIFQRAVILGIKPSFKIPFNGRHGSDYYDTMIAWAGYKGSISQDDLCKALGVQGKPDDIDGSQVWDFVKSGDVARVEEYNRDDIDKVRQIHNRINFK